MGRAKRCPFRMAARRSSSSPDSDAPPQPMTSSRIPVGIDSSSTSWPGLGAPRLSAGGSALPPVQGSPSPITASWVAAAGCHPFGLKITRSRDSALMTNAWSYLCRLSPHERLQRRPLVFQDDDVEDAVRQDGAGIPGPPRSGGALRCSRSPKRQLAPGCEGGQQRRVRRPRGAMPPQEARR